MKLIKILILSIIIFSTVTSYAASKNSCNSSQLTTLAQDAQIAEHFNWNDSKSILNAKKIKQLETVATISKEDLAALNANDKKMLAEINFKLGTYYTHVLSEPDLAIKKLTLADQLTPKTADKAWIYNHLAYAYELKYANSQQVDDKQSALYFSNKVISKFKADSDEVAFAYCIKGLIFNDAYDHHNAEVNLQKALAIYEQHDAIHTEQYIRTKNRLASIILDQHGREQEVLSLLTPLKKYWLATTNLKKNPYAARTFITIGQTYLKMGQSKLAIKNFALALSIYKNVYGASNKQLAKLYDLLAQAYQVAGKTKLARAYAKKLSALKTNT